MSRMGALVEKIAAFALPDTYLGVVSTSLSIVFMLNSTNYVT